MRGRAIGPATTDSARIAVPIPPGDRHAGRGLGVAGRPRFANWLLTLLFLFATAPYASAAGPPVDWSKVAHRVIPAVVNISVAKIGRGGGAAGIGTRERFSGSGFIIDPQGDIVTNKHVIKGAFRIEVMLHDGTELRAHVVAAAAMVDLAVIRIDAGKPLPYLTMASTDTVRVGDPVLAVGNPLGIGTSVSSGIVSALNRNLRNSPFDDYVQTDAAINHGNSGGPLLNTAGQVIGVNTILLTNQKNEGSNGLGFAISSVVVNYVVQHLENPAQAPVGWIGTHVQDVTSDLARAFAMPRHAGCVITKVDPDSPARRAGLRSGDVILAYGGKPLANARQLMREVATTPIGRAKRLRIWRRGMARSVRVTVRAWPNLMEPHGAMLPGNNIKRPVRSPNLGMLMAPLTPLARKQYGLQGVHGVLVVAVDRQSEAFAQGVDPGDVIEQVQGVAVSDPGQVTRLARRMASPGGIVALLVRWPPGQRWIALHTGNRALPATAHGAKAPAHGTGPGHTAAAQSATTPSRH